MLVSSVLNLHVLLTESYVVTSPPKVVSVFKNLKSGDVHT